MMDNNEILAALTTLEQLRKQAEHLSFDKLGVYSERDIRRYLPAQLNKVLIHNNLNLNYYYQTVIYKDRLDTVLFSTTAYDHFELVKSYHGMQILSVVIGLCSVFERYIRVIAELLYGKNMPSKIFKIREMLIVEMDISKDDPLWIGQCILFNIRNTVHNNGIFTDNFEFNATYAGRSHWFKKGQSHCSGDFRTISFIVKDIIEFYNRTLQIPKIQATLHIPEIF